jgi:hypothetical protein
MARRPMLISSNCRRQFSRKVQVMGAECEVWMGELRSRPPADRSAPELLLGRIAKRLEKFVNHQRSFRLKLRLLVSRTQILRLRKVSSVSSHHGSRIACLAGKVVELQLMKGKLQSRELRRPFSMCSPRLPLSDLMLLIPAHSTTVP